MANSKRAELDAGYAAEVAKMQAEAQGRKTATLPKKGQRGFQANVRQKIGEHTDEHTRRTTAVRAKAVGTNRRYLENPPRPEFATSRLTAFCTRVSPNTRRRRKRVRRDPTASDGNSGRSWPAKTPTSLPLSLPGGAPVCLSYQRRLCGEFGPAPS